MSVASGSCLPCVEGRHHTCAALGLWDECPCYDRDHAPIGPDAPWTFADLDAMERDYGRGGHDDVIALIRGVRAVLRLCDGWDRHGSIESRATAAAVTTALNEGATR